MIKFNAIIYQFLILFTNNNTNILEIVSIINNPLFTTILGLIGGWISKIAYDKVSQRNKSKNVKSMIETEILFNKKLLLNLKKTIDDESIVELNCPNFSLDSWNALINDISNFFGNDDFNNFVEFYFKLKHLIDSDFWIKPFKKESIYENGVLIIDRPITTENFNLIDDAKIKINKEIDELLLIIDDLNF